MHEDVNERFDNLVNNLNAILRDVHEKGAAFQRGDYERAPAFRSRAEKMRKIIADIRAKQQEW